MSPRRPTGRGKGRTGRNLRAGRRPISRDFSVKLGPVCEGFPSAVGARRLLDEDLLPLKSVKIIQQVAEVDNPAHYGGEDNPHEHVKCMEATGLYLNAFLYNCTKYIWRQGKKPHEPSLRDLQKARWYLEREISRLERLAHDRK